MSTRDSVERLPEVIQLGNRKVRLLGAVLLRDHRGRVAVRNVETNRLSYIPEWRLRKAVEKAVKLGQRVPAVDGHSGHVWSSDLLTDGFYDAGRVWVVRCECGANEGNFTAEKYAKAWHRQHRFSVLSEAKR